jgi:CheY-like chemotaxis protein
LTAPNVPSEGEDRARRRDTELVARHQRQHRTVEADEAAYERVDDDQRQKLREILLQTTLDFAEGCKSGRHLQRLVNPHEVVVDEVQRHRVRVHLDLLAEGSDPSSGQGTQRAIPLDGPSRVGHHHTMQAEQPIGGHAADILVVEDHAETREMVAIYLAEHHISARTASNAFEALDAVRSSPPALILLDLMMPQLSGESFRRFLSADPRLAGIPVVVVSASPTADEESQRMGAVACIHKPVDLDRMLSIIKRYLPAH